MIASSLQMAAQELAFPCGISASSGTPAAGRTHCTASCLGLTWKVAYVLAIV